MGSDTFSTPILAALAGSAAPTSPSVVVSAIVTQPDRPSGRGRALSSNPVKRLALDRAWPILQPPSLRAPEAIEAVRSLAPDLIVVASFGQFLPQAILELPRYACLNVHPSLLPLGRGPTPIQSAVLAGERNAGVTVMKMTSRMDAGPIVAQIEASSRLDETAGELESRLANLGAQLLVDTLPHWIAGTVEVRSQDDEAATYTKLLRKEDGIVSWNEPASAICRRILAFNPWPAARTSWKSTWLRLLRARPISGAALPGEVMLSEGRLLVGTGDGLIELVEVQAAGARPMPAAYFARGHPAIIGAILGAPD